MRRFFAAAIVVCSAGALAGIAYGVCALLGLAAFRRRTTPQASHSPGISILKPLHGGEPRLYENLASFCRQNYPDFEIIFGTASSEDPALQTVSELQQHFANVRIRIVCGTAESEEGNPKVRNLERLMRAAEHDLLVTADSDIEVGPEYLGAIAAVFDTPDVGAATCLYGGVPAGGTCAQLGAMHVNDYFAPSVIVATMLSPLEYCFGATVAFRREALERVGGFRALAAELADDYALGRSIAQAGYRVALCPYVVATTIHEDNFLQLWAREVRWARTIRCVRPAGYAGSVVTYALSLATATAFLRPSVATGALTGAAAAIRLALHFQGGRIFAPAVRATPWLIPLRDLLELAVWCAGSTGRNVRWRTARYTITSRGRITADEGTTSAPSSRAGRRNGQTPLQ